MKKIISLFITATMLLAVLSSFALVASASDVPTVSVELANVSDETFAVGTTFELHVKYAGVPVSENEDDWAGEGMSYLNFQLSVPGYGSTFKGNGKTWVVDSLGSASSASAVKNMDGTVYKYEWNGPVTADGVYRVGEGTVAVIKLKVNEEITSDVEFDLVQAWIETLQFDAEEKKIGGGKWTSIDGNGEAIVADASAAKITISGGNEEEPVNTVDVSKAVTVTTEAAATDCQIGSAVAMTANAGDATFKKMKWAITTEAGRLFSKTITFDLPVSGVFSVAATFINGAHNEKFDVEPVAPATISEVGAIFTDGTADYFTNKKDADFKAK